MTQDYGNGHPAASFFRRDAAVLFALWGHALFAALPAAWPEASWLLGLGIGVPLALLGTLSCWLIPNRTLADTVVGLFFSGFLLLFVQQTDGLPVALLPWFAGMLVLAGRHSPVPAMVTGISAALIVVALHLLAGAFPVDEALHVAPATLDNYELIVVLLLMCSTSIAASLQAWRSALTLREPVDSEAEQQLRTLSELLDCAEGDDIRAALQARLNEADTLRDAIDQAGTSLMMVDSEGRITDCNRAMSIMLSVAAGELRHRGVNIMSGDICGSSFYELCRDTQSSFSIAALHAPIELAVQIAEHAFSVTLSPIVATDGRRQGAIAEWQERTAIIAAEEEIERVFSHAASGDLSLRIDETGKGPFHQTLAINLNQLLGTTSQLIEHASTALTDLASGKLTNRVSGSFEGDFASLRDDINHTIEKLTGIVEGIKHTSGGVDRHLQELLNGTHHLTERTTQQASSLEETAASMEEMTASVKTTADNAGTANQLASQARQQAEQGGDVVERAVSAMGAITESSRRISEIINVIDEIAFQTNLLALNAAVEAARAGEQGRGFAVVANEVRNLASRSATAAREIKELIEDSVGKVTEGSRLVDESGNTLRTIVESVEKVSNVVAEIANASAEQSSGLALVNRAISQMDEMTQQNASLVNEAARAGQTIDEQLRGLESLVSFFDTGRQARPQTIDPWQVAS